MLDHDDFRVRVEVADPRRLLDALREAQVGESERAALGRVATTHEDGHVFIYADSLSVAQVVRDSVEAVIGREGIEGAVTVWRWHPLEERWEDASAPLPETSGQRDREHQRLIADEDSQTHDSPYAEWEVRATLPTHHDARALASRLHSEGVPLRHYWRHVLIGAPDEDAARRLAARVRAEAAPGTEVVVEAVGQPIWEAMHPYSIFGGLGV